MKSSNITTTPWKGFIRVDNEAVRHATRYPDLAKLNFPMYSGCRNEAIAYAIEVMGISLDEIVGKLSDDIILQAIQSSVEVMGLMPYE